MLRTKSRALSREEEAELERSNKKVKDVRHAEFMASHGKSSHVQGGIEDPFLGESSSFRDKLLGEIPGAYDQAFAFDDRMEADIDSDEELDELREGFAAVKLSKDVKHRIRAAWATSLIVKVYGRSVGFNYIQAKLNALWKPTGRLDVIDLGEEFFLTRFSCKDDHAKVLRNGPWFIGEHFLSLRPWEPNFKPSTTKVSAIAVWVRLNELPIEYYDVEVLKQIGNSIGKILRIDTHTAAEARGRFARLCVQVDIDKPLVTNISIGGLHQPVNYEGIHRLCFSCGRIGHRKDGCPHILRSPPRADKDAEVREEVQVSNSRVGCDLVDPMQHEAGRSAEQEDIYGSWMVVTRKRQGTKGARYKPEGSGGTGGTGNTFRQVSIKSKHSRGNTGVSDVAHPKSQAQASKDLSISDHGEKELGFSLDTEIRSGSIQLGCFNVGSDSIQAHNGSVKGKKDLARSRAHFIPVIVADGSESLPKSPQFASISSCNNKTSAQNFKFTASARNEVGDKVEGDDLENSSSGHCRITGQGEKFLETSHLEECREERSASDGFTQGEVFSAMQVKQNGMEEDSLGPVKPGAMHSGCNEAVVDMVDGDRSTGHRCRDQQSRVLLKSFAEVRPIDGVVEADGMEFEGGGENPTSC